MSNKSGNKKKSDQLGMSHGAAANRLRKSIMFALIMESGKNTCFQCHKKIENIDDLSVEHKVPWLDSEDPVKLYFDLDNIAFSHITCNYRAARKRNKGVSVVKHGTDTKYGYGCRCEPCRIAANKTRQRYRKLHASVA